MNDSGPDGTPSHSKEWNEYAERFLTAAAVVVLGTGTIMYRLLEGWSWVDALYFSVVTATTVGFGDLSPTTDASKLFTVLYIFSSIAVIAAFINARGKRHVQRVAQRRRT